MRIAAAERRIFDGNSALAGDPALRRYLSDMVGPFGLEVRQTDLGHSYGEMAEPLIAALATAPVNLLILAYGVHDVRLGRATATYLSSRCPGEPLAFAVCDQGTAAAFTALNLINAYNYPRAMLIVAEQSAIHYEPAAPAPIPERHAAVGFLIEQSADQRIHVDQYPDIDLDEATKILAEQNDRALIVSPNVSLPDARQAPEGQPYTGVWWELAGTLDDPEPVTIADYDPVLRYLCVATVSA
jgi:4-hydroxymandelate oxidase